MKSDKIYTSKNNDRQWRIIDGVLNTRLPGGIWGKAGWPNPDMKKSDIQYYIEKGEMFSIDED